MRKIVIACALFGLVAFGCAAEEEPTVTDPEATSEATSSPQESPQGSPAEYNDEGTETFEDTTFEVEVELDDFYFKPTFIKSPGGATATLKLHNEGEATHTFTVDALDVDEELEAGATKEIEVEIGTETRYEFYCRFHQGQGMRGAFQPH